MSAGIFVPAQKPDGLSICQAGKKYTCFKEVICGACEMIRKTSRKLFPLFLLLVLAVSAVRYLPGMISVSSNVSGKELPIYSVDTDKKQVALSFDAAWGNEDTQTLLDILKKYHVKTTFFMTGGWVDSYPEDVKKILADGHDLGNHSEHHKNMSQLSKEEQKEEIMSVHRKVKELTDYEMFLFRPPYGDYDNSVILGAQEDGYYPVQWSIDSLDWKNYGAASIEEKVLESKDLQNGAIILMHNGAKYTKDALEKVIVGLQEKGYEIVPVSKLIYRENYHMDVAGRQIPDRKK